MQAERQGVVELARTCQTCGNFKLASEMVKGKTRCKACRRVADYAYEKANREAITQRNRERRNADLERARELERASRERNREKLIARRKAYLAKNHEVLKAKRRARYLEDPSVVITAALARLLKRNTATPPWADKKAIKAIYRRAQYLRSLGDNVEVDHCIPLQGKLVSGLHVESNLVIRKKLINRRKSNKFSVTWDWVLINGRLEVEL